MDRVTLCDDGVYRWSYEFDMLKNPVIILSILKLIVYILGGMWIMFSILSINTHGGLFASFVNELQALALPAVIMLVLSVISYAILASMYGWKYYVLFEMDEHGIRHIQMDKQFEKAQILGRITSLVGASAKNPGIVGAGLLSGTKQQQYSQFDKVKRISVNATFGTIKLDYPMSHNQIYVSKEDFDFVLAFINSKISIKGV